VQLLVQVLANDDLKGYWADRLIKKCAGTVNAACICDIHYIFYLDIEREVFLPPWPFLFP